jgi:hypothetical protein
LDALFLSYFDELLGASQFHAVPLAGDPPTQKFCSRIRRKVAKLAAIPTNESFFTRDFDAFSTASIRVSVRSEWTHSARQILTITVATESLDPIQFREGLEEAGARLQKMPDVASAFYERARPGDESVRAANNQLKAFVAQMGEDIRQMLTSGTLALMPRD